MIIALCILAYLALGFIFGFITLAGMDVDNGIKVECPTYEEVIQLAVLSSAMPFWVVAAVVIWVIVFWKFIFGDKPANSWWNKKICGDK
jgi:predicted anti-sigma-YlaC factor YlaD